MERSLWTCENSMCKDPGAGKIFKYPQNWKKGSEALEAADGRAGAGIQVVRPAFLSIPATSTAQAFLVSAALFLRVLCKWMK